MLIVSLTYRKRCIFNVWAPNFFFLALTGFLMQDHHSVFATGHQNTIRNAVIYDKEDRKVNIIPLYRNSFPRIIFFVLTFSASFEWLSLVTLQKNALHLDTWLSALASVSYPLQIHFVVFKSVIVSIVSYDWLWIRIAGDAYISQLTQRTGFATFGGHAILSDFVS